MPAISFQRGFLDALLRGDKQQTSRRQTDRIKVGDVCNIYTEQRRRIRDKPTRRMTEFGEDVINQKRSIPYDKRTYPPVHPDTWIRGLYHAHFIGQVAITEVYDMCPCDNSARSAWAKADGFTNFGCADKWFTERYGHEWYQQTWTVIRWNGWAERYFEPER